MPTLGKGLSPTVKLIVLHFQGLCRTRLLPPFYDCKALLPPKISLPWGVDRYQHFHVFSIFYKCTVTIVNRTRNCLGLSGLREDTATDCKFIDFESKGFPRQAEVAQGVPGS